MLGDKESPLDESSSRRDQRQHFVRRHRFLIIGSAVVVMAAAIVVFIILSTSQRVTNSTPANRETSVDGSKVTDLFMQQYGSNCKDRPVSFTSPPMKMSDLAYIRPLGAVSDGHVTPTDHVYVGPPNQSAADNTYPVLMPADGTITQVSAMPASYIGDRSGQQVAPEDHRLVISFSCRYFAIYIHIHKLSDALSSVVGQLQPNQNKTTSIDLKAGDVVGYIGGSTFDWTPIDTSVKLSGFITPSLYNGESWKIHTVSPFDLYKEPLKSQLEAKSLRSISPIGGKIDYDQPGKLIGNWFREGTNGYQGASQDRYWDGHLSIAPDYIDPASTVVSIGNWQGSAQQFVVVGSVDPSKVGKTDGMVKYELARMSYAGANGQDLNGRVPARGMHVIQNGSPVGTVLLQVLDGEKLKIERFPGKAPAQVGGFTPAAQTYER